MPACTQGFANAGDLPTDFFSGTAALELAGLHAKARKLDRYTLVEQSAYNVTAMEQQFSNYLAAVAIYL